MKVILKAVFCGAMAAGISLGTAIAADGLTAEARRTAVDQLGRALRDRYVFPEVGAKAAAALEARARSGAYDTFEDRVQFTAKLSDDIFAVAHDKHLAVFALGSPSPPELPPSPHNDAGVVRADRLHGGIGYIEISAFPAPHLAKPVVDKALTALAGSKSLVIDVRRNTGGSPGGIAYLMSFLVRPGAPVRINDIVMREEGTMNFTRQAFDSSPTPVNFAGRPIVVLTSKGTNSGGEEFAYDVQSLKIGTLIGEITRGAANPALIVPIGSEMSAVIPFGRPENPITKSNWDGVGVRPDIEVNADRALEAALARLGAKATADLTLASEQQVFAPRSEQATGSDAALRRLLADLVRGTPDYSTMGSEQAELTRKGLGDMSQLAKLGGVQRITFREVGVYGDDVFDVAFANGVKRTGIALSSDGKVLGWWFY